MEKKFIIREVCCDKEPQYLVQKNGTFYLSRISNIWEAASFSTKEEAESAYKEHAQSFPIEIVEVYSKYE